MWSTKLSAWREAIHKIYRKNKKLLSRRYFVEVYRIDFPIVVMLSDSFSASSETAPRSSVSRASGQNAQPSPGCDDGAGFAMTLVLSVAGFLVLAAGLADWIHRIG
jgi:hypothetical protein